MPSPPWPSSPGSARAIETSAPAVSARAVSLSALAGTSTAALCSVRCGFQRSSRTASRYRSVEIRVSVSPSISILTPVSAGRVSSRPAAIADWLTAVAKASLPTDPAAGGIAGSAGYSSSGMVSRLNVALPQVRTARPESAVICTGLAGRLRLISASSRPETSAEPSSVTVVSGTVAWADTS
jgi:hypothetical protein